MAFQDQGEPPDTDSTLTVPPSATVTGLVLHPWIEQDMLANVRFGRISARG
jgi:hypothetical protein